MTDMVIKEKEVLSNKFCCVCIFVIAVAANKHIGFM